MIDSKKILTRLLKDTNNIFYTNNILLWLDCGTLLGAVRDHDFIPWDKDIDLGCWKSINDYKVKQILKGEFVKFGYSVFINDHYLNIHLENFPEINCDVNFYTIEGDMAITPSSSLYPFLNDKISILANHIIKFIYNRKFYVKRYPVFIKMILKLYFLSINFIFSLMPSKTKALFLDLLILIRKKASRHKAEVVPKYFFNNFKIMSVFEGEYLIPEKSEEYLKFRYGEDWKTPKQLWDTFTQDGTVKNIL